MKLSNRILEMQASPIRKLIPLAQESKKRGITVYHLNIGQPDIETPKVFFDAIHNFEGNILKYALSPGETDLIQAIQAYFKRDGILFDTDEIIVTSGGSEALIFAVQAICDPGDEILIPEPFYTNYNGFIRQSGVKVKPIMTCKENGFHLPKKEDIVKEITPRTKAILFSNPGNPTGTVYTMEELEVLKEIVLEHDLFLISDEVYRKLVFDGLSAPSLGFVKGIEDRGVIIESVSKRYSSCGARIGSVQSKNKELMKQIVKLAQARLSVSTIDQVGAVKLYQLSDEYVDSTRAEYEKRRDIVLAELAKIEGVEFQKPEGAFYIVVTLPVADAEEFVKWMLTDFNVDNETVMLAPAEDFYAHKGMGKNQVRIAYVLESKKLQRAMQILNIAIKAYKKNH